MASNSRIEGVAAMHYAAVIPHHHVAVKPFVGPGILVSCRMIPYGVEQFLALLDRKTDNPGIKPTAEEEAFAIGLWMGTDERVSCAWRLRRVACLRVRVWTAGGVEIGAVVAKLPLDPSLDVIGQGFIRTV